MKRRVLAALGLMVLTAGVASAQTQISNPSAAYVSGTTLLPISAGEFNTFGSVSAGPWTLSFSSDLQALNVPSTWGTWSCAPFSERACDAAAFPVGFTSGQNSLTMTLNGTAHTFGFELEPDAFEVDNFVAEFYHNGSPVFSFDQDVDGNGGARLFAATGGDFDQVVITSSGGDFALAQFRVGGDISTVPEPSTMGLIATGLVGMGGLGRFRRRRRA